MQRILKFYKTEQVTETEEKLIIDQEETERAAFTDWVKQL